MSYAAIPAATSPRESRALPQGSSPPSRHPEPPPTPLRPLAPSPAAIARPDGRRTGRYLAWSPAEEAVIRAYYPRGGALACQPLLPARQAEAIAMKAQRLGVRYRDGYQYQPPSDERTDRLLRELYVNGSVAKGSMAALAVKLGRPRQWLRQRAIALGVAASLRGPNWRPEEDAILEALEGRGPRAMQKALARAGYRRPETAIAARCSRISISAGLDRSDVYSGNEIGRLLGIHDHRVITRWIKSGALRATAERAPLPPHEVISWRVRRQDLRSWMIANPLLWWPGRCDRYWLVEILSGKEGAW